MKLNSILSISATVSKSSLLMANAAAMSQLKWIRLGSRSKRHRLYDIQLYDDASRGPWGSLMLLMSNKKLSVSAMRFLRCAAYFPFSYQKHIIFTRSCAICDSSDVRKSQFIHHTRYSSARCNELLALFKRVTLTPGSLWASLAALVILLSMLFDVFVQQSVQISDVVIYQKNTAATLKRASSFSDTSIGQLGLFHSYHSVTSI